MVSELCAEGFSCKNGNCVNFLKRCLRDYDCKPGLTCIDMQCGGPPENKMLPGLDGIPYQPSYKLNVS